MSSDSLKTKSAHFINRLLHGIKPNDKGELADMIKDASDRDIIDDDTESMLSGVFEISKRRLCDIMIPRSQMITIDSNSSIEDAVKIIAKHGHSRYPVICEDKDHIIGILLAKDLLPYAINSEKNKPTVDKLVHPLVIVPEFKRVDSMLKEFQENRFHMAVVVDEFGGVCGLVTIEDILEIIVGDIGDEYDDEEDTLTDDIIKSADDSYLIKGQTPIEAFNDFFKTTLPKVDVDTVAGMVIHALGHLPQKDESVSINGFNFKVLNATHRQVQLLQVRKENLTTYQEQD
ncbi:HlyC/CorC family transporter [Succinatimonas hippei]|uniref:HlyC/CorC family transporter n=1 Tax=Succinatimonas hippei TaxID=626938 RepID=UPI00255D0071|nr:transporter associated domain-containing protein [Succinatimonas hippei]